MKEIQKREVKRVAVFLESLGCNFKIIDPEGVEYGALEVKRKPPRQEEYGVIRAYYLPLVNLNAEVGSVQEIAIGHFSPEQIRSGVCNLLMDKWGRDSYTTSRNRANNTIEVLRVA